MLVTILIAFFYVMAFLIPAFLIWGVIDAVILEPMKDKAYQRGFEDGSKSIEK